MRSISFTLWGMGFRKLLGKNVFLAKITIDCRIRYIDRGSNSALLHVKLTLCCAR
jgi:hypothetical protein